MCKLAVDVKATCAVFRPEMRGAERVDPVARLAMKDRSVEERTPRARLNANRGEAGQLARLKSAALLVRVGLDHEPWLRRALARLGDGAPAPGGPRPSAAASRRTGAASSSASTRGSAAGAPPWRRIAARVW